jgi:hypothetical protein
MASFVAAMNAPTLTKVGVKGSDVYTEDGVGDRRVALFQQLVRGVKPEDIEATINAVFSDPAADPTVLRDYAVMAFQTRDVRGGKGERDIFYAMLPAILKHRPDAAAPLIRLIPEYGCWRDCWELWSHTELRPHIEDLVKWVFFEDMAKVEQGKPPSLLGKWLPREKGKHHEIAVALSSRCFPEIPTNDDQLRAYRKACTKLNAALKTTEVNMCNGTWSDIKPSAVPGRLLTKARKAFLNEIVEHKGRPGRRVYGGGGPFRCPYNDDRMSCREHFMEHTEKALKGEVKMKGADVVYPHELVAKVLQGNSSAAEDDMIEAQWRALRDAAAAQGGLGRAVAMSDFSGSMAGTPMTVSMALGILISELTHPAFKGYFLGFDSNPNWIHVGNKGTLKEKVNYAEQFAQGLSTNFEAAYDRILERMVKYKVPADEAPQDLIVLTDMGFDAACGGISNDVHKYGHHEKFHMKTSAWATHMDHIRAKFAAAGYVAPRIVLWNLRSEYKDYHAKADEDGVVILSGWSPAVLKAITAGKLEVRTPLDGLRQLLDAPRYDAVRAAFRSKDAPTS